MYNSNLFLYRKYARSCLSSFNWGCFSFSPFALITVHYFNYLTCATYFSTSIRIMILLVLSERIVCMYFCWIYLTFLNYGFTRCLKGNLIDLLKRLHVLKLYERISPMLKYIPVIIPICLKTAVCETVRFKYRYF